MRWLGLVPDKPEKSILMEIRVHSDMFADFDIFGQNQSVWVRIDIGALFSAGEAISGILAFLPKLQNPLKLGLGS